MLPCLVSVAYAFHDDTSTPDRSACRLLLVAPLRRKSPCIPFKAVAVCVPSGLGKLARHRWKLSAPIQDFAPTIHPRSRTGTQQRGLGQWFLTLSAVTDTSITSWNCQAPLLGSKGHPGYLIRHLIKWVLYPKSVTHPVGSLFEAIEQDERP